MNFHTIKTASRCHRLPPEQYLDLRQVRNQFEALHLLWERQQIHRPIFYLTFVCFQRKFRSCTF